MGKFVKVDGSGVPTGFYDSAINPTIPAGAVPITNAQYSTLRAGGATFIGGALGTIATAAVVVPPATQALLALAAGLAVTSTAHAAVNGTYGLDPNTMSLAADLAALITGNSGAFPGSVSTWSWPDLAGTLHVFPSAATFLAFQKAIATYRLSLYAVVWGVSSSIPAASATIA